MPQTTRRCFLQAFTCQQSGFRTNINWFEILLCQKQIVLMFAFSRHTRTVSLKNMEVWELFSRYLHAVLGHHHLKNVNIHYYSECLMTNLYAVFFKSIVHIL